MTINKTNGLKNIFITCQLMNRDISYFNRPFTDNCGTVVLQGKLIYLGKRLLVDK